jgi:hypothetical protein
MPAIGIANRRNSKLPEPPSGAKPNILSMKSISISQFTTCSLDTLRFAKVRVKGYQVRKRAQSSVRATNGLEDDKPMLRKILDQSFARPSEYSRCKTSSIDSQPHGSPCKRPRKCSSNVGHAMVRIEEARGQDLMLDLGKPSSLGLLTPAHRSNTRLSSKGTAPNCVRR